MPGHFAPRLCVGSRVRGKVVSLVDYGAFVELEPGIEGLVHISEMTWSHEIKHPSKLVAVGDQVEAQVLNVERKGRKISLGMKQVAANPWEVVETKYPVGSVIEGKVKSLTEFGVFVGLDEGIDGIGAPRPRERHVEPRARLRVELAGMGCHEIRSSLRRRRLCQHLRG